MFGFLKGKKSEIVSPLSGDVLPITECADEVFSSKALGNGLVIMPTGNDVFAPIDGTVVQVAETVHAVCLEGEDGLELLIHLGIDTVSLGGEGFECFVKTGDKVKKGDKIATMDREFIKSKGLKLDSPVILLNEDQLSDVGFNTGTATGGETVIVSYKK